ncbi:Na+/H+ antiporter subunit E [Sphingosinicella humi]|uniref:Na+/H+ antiporter subunit E n=1 Tax=Allosphingosinicella humi TaxID=2068657 RepID=A0A2U2J201_9SPHN|nr:Na+/H+ antiporter subunit E [Sphingosinicella humi]PWG02301.1 Na+/H+ antiporter subunit E [Sphingosinicella humi]
MKPWLPYPLLALALLAMWLLLNQSLAPGQLVLGGAVALFASRAMAALQPEKARIRSVRPIPRLAALVFADIIRSNIAVAKIVLLPGPRRRVAGFVRIPLDMKNRYGLTILACIITATPGTCWVQFDRNAGRLLIHVLDLVDEETWIRLIKQRYERLLMEIFE